MKVFAHINELGGDGWASLRSMVLVCPKVIIWGPSANELRRRRRPRKMLPTPAELLWYIGEGHMQILAREWWIKEPMERAAHVPLWKGNTWTEEFDSPVLQMWDEDEKAKKDELSARVRIAPKETGSTWAIQEIERRNIDCEDFMEKLPRKAFPEGNLEKVAGLAPKDAVKSLLKDGRNHGLAFQYSKAHRNLGSPADDHVLSLIHI